MEVFIRYLRREHNFLSAQIVPFFNFNFFLRSKNNQREGILEPTGLSCCTLQDWLAGANDSVGGILPLDSGLPEGQISGEGHHSMI